MKRLATLWLICAAVGFVAAAGLAVTLALVIDGGAKLLPPTASASADRHPSHLGVAAQIDQGHRLLGN